MSVSEKPTEHVLNDLVQKLIRTDLNRSRSIASRSIRRSVKRWPETSVTKKFIVYQLTILYKEENLKSRAMVIQRMLEPLIRKARSTGEIANDLKVSVRYYGDNRFEGIEDERFIWVSGGVGDLDDVEVLLKLVFVDDLEDIKQYPECFVLGIKEPDTTYYYQP